jgi:hypothetical protein
VGSPLRAEYNALKIVIPNKKKKCFPLYGVYYNNRFQNDPTDFLGEINGYQREKTTWG